MEAVPSVGVAKSVGGRSGDVEQRAVQRGDCPVQRGDWPRGEVEWPLFEGARVRRDAVDELQSALSAPYGDFRYFLEDVEAQGIALAMVEGRPQRFWATLPMADIADLCDLWSDLCSRLEVRMVGSRLASCLVAAFVRAGLPLCGPLPPHRATVAAREPRRAPLCVAVFRCQAVAHALLELPPVCGLDVNLCEAENCGPALGYANFAGPRHISERLFLRLLRRTDRSVVNAGAVHVDRGFEQYADSSTHVLISGIFRSYFYPHAPRSANFARLFISVAEADGDGVDLTASSTTPPGQGTQDAPPSTWDHTPLEQLWPDGKFRGALVLVDTLCRWFATQDVAAQPVPKNMNALTGQFDQIRTELVAALRRIRHYRETIRPFVATPLTAAGIHAHELHLLLIRYLVVPLHDESQLYHPLISTLATTFL